MELERRVVEAFLAKGKRLALAESMTGGLVAERVTRIAGAGDVLVGGIVSYTDEAKAKHLGVPRKLLERHGAVTAEIAVAMAEGARRAFDADVAVSVTGFAGPDAPEGMPVGLVFVGVATAAGASSKELRLDGGRLEIREKAAAEALRLAVDALG